MENNRNPCPWCRRPDCAFLLVNEVTRKWCIECICGARGPQRNCSDEAVAAWNAVQLRDHTEDLDKLDRDAICTAIAVRQRAPLPPGVGSLRGRVIAEICRGWLDMLGEWDGPIKPLEEG